MGRILVTGATGFVGRALVPLLAREHDLVLAGRQSAPESAPDSGRDGDGSAFGIAHCTVGPIGPETDWRAALRSVDQIVHLAAHVHQTEGAGDPADFHRVNAAGTKRLAEAARLAGVQRIVFLSTVKVHGETSGPAPFREDDAPRPQGAYATSKWIAEQALAEIASTGGPAAVILRPPLVYGPGARANFRALVRLCRLGVPLPFGAVENRRSLIFLGNLAAAIARVTAEPVRAGTQTYLLRDGTDLSTGELIRRLAAALGRPARLLPVPPAALALALRLIGRGAVAERLLASLAVDDSRFRRDFGWTPPYTIDQGLCFAAASFR